jgi:type VI protein secretion system component Hcp
MTRPGLARAIRVAGVSLVAALAASGAAHAEIFMKIEGVPGDATQRGFEDQILLTGASLNVMSFLAPDPEGLVDQVRTPTVGPISLTKRPDRASPKLMMAALQGQPVGPIEVTFTGPVRPGVAPVVEARWIIEGVEISSFSTFPAYDGTGAQTETVEFTYATIRYQYFGRDGKGGRGGTMEEVTLKVPDSQLFPFDQGCQ